MLWNDGANVCGSQAGSAVAGSGLATTLSQPLTRAACDEAGLEWNEGANVCSSNVGPAVDQEPARADTGGQPLTRAACNGAGMQWDETSNVCGSVSGVNTSGQPLSRAACVEAGVKWNEISNVCGVSVKDATLDTAPEIMSAKSSGQPLTRAACSTAGMSWNDSTNVCGETSKNVQAARVAPKAQSTEKAERPKAKASKTVERAKTKTTKTAKRSTKRHTQRGQRTVGRSKLSRRLFSNVGSCFGIATGRRQSNNRARAKSLLSVKAAESVPSSAASAAVQQFLKRRAQSAVLELHDNDHDGEHERHRVCQHHWPVPQHHAECEPERDTDRERDVHPERNALRLACMNDLVRLRNKGCRGQQRSNARDNCLQCEPPNVIPALNKQGISRRFRGGN